MAEKFNAELLARSERDGSGRLDIDLVDTKGRLQNLALSPAAARALLEALTEYSASGTPGRNASLVKLPKTFAVGHGVHEAVVLLRFEDDSAYALSVDQASELSEALLDEAQVASEPRYAFKQ